MSSFKVTVLAVGCVVLAGCAGPVKRLLPPEGRVVEGGRNQMVTVVQGEILAEVDETNLATGMGAGLVPALIEAGINSARARNAEEAIVPVRYALADYSFDQMAMAASADISRNVKWLGIRANEFNKDPSPTRFSTAIDRSPGPELFSVGYDYRLDHGFRVLEVGAHVTLLPKASTKSKKPEHRILAGNMTFSRVIIVVMPLGPGTTNDIEANAALWALDGGRQTEAKLDQAFAKIVVLVQKALEFTPEQAAALKSRKVIKSDGIVGRVLVNEDEGRLIVDKFDRWFYVFNPR